MVVTETDKAFVEHIIRTEPNATRMATTFHFKHEPNNTTTHKQPNPRHPMPQSSTIHTPSGHLKPHRTT